MRTPYLHQQIPPRFKQCLLFLCLVIGSLSLFYLFGSSDNRLVSKSHLKPVSLDDDVDDDFEDVHLHQQLSLPISTSSQKGNLHQRKGHSSPVQIDWKASLNETELTEAMKDVVKYRPNLTHLTDLSMEEAHEAMVREYLAPWTGVKGGAGRTKITQRMLAVMEYAYKGGSFRVRIQGGRLFYRKIVHWKQTYRTQRMRWYLSLLHEMLRRDRGLLKEGLAVDFVIYVGDGPKVAADTFTQEAGFPLFSLRTSPLHLDIPIPDPVSHGSNGNYQWTETGKQIEWERRQDRLVFRGRGSCLKMQADNWPACIRVRAQQMALEWPEWMDAGIIEWNQLYKANRQLFPPATPAEVERATGIKPLASMDFDEQSTFKYILDLDGGLGSSRKPGIMSSGSVLFAQASPWYNHYEPLMQPWRHYVPVDRWLRDLTDRIQWARQHDQHMQSMVREQRAFEEKYLSIHATKHYLATLLHQYAELMDMPMPAGLDPIEVDYCERMENHEIRMGPMGCSREWLEYHGGELPEEIASDGKH